MRFDEKINVMLANGKLSSDQAEVLKRSLLGAGATAVDDSTHHRGLCPVMLWGVATLAAVGIVVYAMSGGGDTNLTQEIQNVAESFNQSGKVGEMNKSLSTIIALALFGLPALIWFAFGYNSLVSKEEDVIVAWSQVESNYQRRTDLIPNLINTVKSFTEHEGKTYAEITKLRSGAERLATEQNKAKEISGGSVTKLSDEAYMENLAKAQTGVSEGLKGLMLSVEAYPDLRSSDQYLALQAELEGTENRINVARLAFNEKVGEFNSAIRRLPGNLIASAGSFKRKAYFKADEGANKVVKFTPDAPKTAE